jgi:predicted Rossmann fold flavoprotein
LDEAATTCYAVFQVTMTKQQTIIIGAGAGGLLAAGSAAHQGAEVLVLEKMNQPGKKILISGKTRCNLTNSRDLADFILAYGPNGRFLYPAFHRFFREDLLACLVKYGVETKEERGGRIFPASDNAQDVVKALLRRLTESGAKLLTGVKATAIRCHKGQVEAVLTDKGEYPAGAVILATGGSSWPATGSTGDGYRIAQELGHTIVKLRPALVPLVVEEVELARSMQGVSLKNVRLTAYHCRAAEIDQPRSGKKIIDSRLGEMLLTHFGIGGPITLQMSLDIVDALAKGPVSVAIDLKPALEHEDLIIRLQRDFDNYSKRAFQNILKELLPHKMIEPVMKLSGIPAEKPGHQINAAERDKLATLVKSLRFNIKSPLPLSAAMVTAGGVALPEIDPRTMGSRLIKGLYFCGEVMDINADTGGYNLQAAFSTGCVAGESAAAFSRGTPAE